MRFRTMFFFLLLATRASEAQESTIFRTPDSLTLRMLVFPTERNEFLEPPFVDPHTPADSAAARAYRIAFLHTQLLSLPETFDRRFDLAPTLHLESRIDNRYQFLRATLNAFLVGGEAYMVYRALKKYRYIR